MSEEKVNLDKKVEELEAAAKKYASKDTVISVGGYDFTPAKLMVVATILSSVLGALYGAFEVYKDYIGMKKKIAEYVSPEENSAKTAKAVQEGSDKTAEYTRDIKNDLKGDIRRLEKVVESVETSNKQQQREIDKTVTEIKTEVRSIQRAADVSLNAATKEMNKMSADNAKAIAANNREVDAKLKALDKKINEDLKKALDNPLANK
jgi:tetrahydromethanopterin S-methyltransferase subunit F